MGVIATSSSDVNGTSVLLASGSTGIAACAAVASSGSSVSVARPPSSPASARRHESPASRRARTPNTAPPQPRTPLAPAVVHDEVGTSSSSSINAASARSTTRTVESKETYDSQDLESKYADPTSSPLADALEPQPLYNDMNDGDPLLQWKEAEWAYGSAEAAEDAQNWRMSVPPATAFTVDSSTPAAQTIGEAVAADPESSMDTVFTERGDCEWEVKESAALAEALPRPCCDCAAKSPHLSKAGQQCTVSSKCACIKRGGCKPTCSAGPECRCQSHSLMDSAATAGSKRRRSKGVSYANNGEGGGAASSSFSAGAVVNVETPSPSTIAGQQEVLEQISRANAVAAASSKKAKKKHRASPRSPILSASGGALTAPASPVTAAPAATDTLLQVEPAAAVTHIAVGAERDGKEEKKCASTRGIEPEQTAATAVSPPLISAAGADTVSTEAAQTAARREAAIILDGAEVAASSSGSHSSQRGAGAARRTASITRAEAMADVITANAAQLIEDHHRANQLICSVTASSIAALQETVEFLLKRQEQKDSQEVQEHRRRLDAITLEDVKRIAALQLETKTLHSEVASLKGLVVELGTENGRLRTRLEAQTTEQQSRDSAYNSMSAMFQLRDSTVQLLLNHANAQSDRERLQWAAVYGFPQAGTGAAASDAAGANLGPGMEAGQSAEQLRAEQQISAASGPAESAVEAPQAGAAAAEYTSIYPSLGSDGVCVPEQRGSAVASGTAADVAVRSGRAPNAGSGLTDEQQRRLDQLSTQPSQQQSQGELVRLLPAQHRAAAAQHGALSLTSAPPPRSYASAVTGPGALQSSLQLQSAMVSQAGRTGGPHATTTAVIKAGTETPQDTASAAGRSLHIRVTGPEEGWMDWKYWRAPGRRVANRLCYQSMRAFGGWPEVQQDQYIDNMVKHIEYVTILDSNAGRFENNARVVFKADSVALLKTLLQSLGDRLVSTVTRAGDKARRLEFSYAVEPLAITATLPPTLTRANAMELALGGSTFASQPQLQATQGAGSVAVAQPQSQRGVDEKSREAKSDDDCHGAAGEEITEPGNDWTTVDGRGRGRKRGGGRRGWGRGKAGAAAGRVSFLHDPQAADEVNSSGRRAPQAQSRSQTVSAQSASGVSEQAVQRAVEVAAAVIMDGAESGMDVEPPQRAASAPIEPQGLASFLPAPSQQ